MNPVTSQDEMEDEKNFEDFSLLWCDANMNSTEKICHTQTQLRKTINYLKLFKAGAECKAYIQRHPNDKIILIVSENVGQDLIPQIHDLKQVITIYIYPCKAEKRASEYRKLKDITTSAELVERIREDHKERNNRQQEELPISILELTHQSLDSEFMWFQLIIEVLLRMNASSRKSAFNNLINSSRQQYDGNDRNLDIVNELSDEYKPQEAIRWYTRDSFIYRVLNKALRQQDIDVLIKFSFLIRDLCDQLRQEQQFDESVIKVFRGQLMAVKELEILKAKKNCFISVNTFFSTSRNRQIALIFAGNENTEPLKASVLFEIEVNTQLNVTKPYAKIDRLSAFENTEEEVLFMLGNVFKIVDISWNEGNQVWVIKMDLASEEESELKSVFESIKSKMEDETGLISLGNILWHMGKFNKAEEIYKLLLNSLPEGDPNVSKCYGNLGLINRNNHHYTSAYSYFQKALEFELKKPASDQLSIATAYTNIGVVLTDQKEYERALEYLTKALNLFSKRFGHAHHHVADTYLNIGNVYSAKKNFDLALFNYNECLQIKMKLLPENHFDIAQLLYNTANVHYEKEEYQLALSDYEKALSIQLLYIPNHIDTAKTYANIAQIYAKGFQNYSAALTNSEKALKIFQNALEANHPFIIQTQIDIRYTKQCLHRLM